VATPITCTCRNSTSNSRLPEVISDVDG
jgi:hypothetical protein